MITTFILPKYSQVIYGLNHETKYYTQTEIKRQETPLKRLPLQIRVAPIGAANVKPNASKLLLSKECSKGKYSFITGVQNTLFENWFLGNDYEYLYGQKIISIIVFHFANNENELHVYYFHRYDKPNTSYRMQFANKIIPVLKEMNT
jgi:hypothetical protein